MIKGRHGLLEAVPLPTYSTGGGNDHILKPQLYRVGGSEATLVFFLAHGEAGSVTCDKETAEPFVALASVSRGDNEV